MKKIMNSSKYIFISLIIIITFYVSSIADKQYKYDIEQLNNIMNQMNTNFNNILNNLYFSVEMVEQISMNAYSNKNREDLDDIFELIVDEFQYRSVAILPDGIVEYIYPLEGNEEAIGENILKIPNKVKEAEIAIETRDIIMSGPYELTQGEEVFIMRKAVFVEEKLWGVVVVVMDKDILLEQVNLQVFSDANYEYRFSAIVNNGQEIIIDEIDGFDKTSAKWGTIELANGYWKLGVESRNNARYNMMFILILVMGYIISFIIAYSVNSIENKLKYAKEEVFIDKLTGVRNRKYLDEIQNMFIKNNTTYTVIYIDLNNFKFVNDTYGHNIGDELLIIFTDRVKSTIRDTDYIIRMGGDEFVIILPYISNIVDIENFCKRLKKIEVATIKIDHISRQLKFTYGYDSCSSNEKTLSEVIINADRNMYVMKHENKVETTTRPKSRATQLATK